MVGRCSSDQLNSCDSKVKKSVHPNLHGRELVVGRCSSGQLHSCDSKGPDVRLVLVTGHLVKKKVFSSVQRRSKEE